MKQAAKERWEEIKAAYKINYDGTIFAKENKSGIKVVVRDYHGQVIASLVQQLGQAYQAVEVEALTACRALEFGSEIGIRSTIVEEILRFL